MNTIYECDICGCYHPWDFNGDCRDNKNRYGDPDDYADKHGINPLKVEVKSMNDRIEADLNDTDAFIDSRLKAMNFHRRSL